MEPYRIMTLTGNGGGGSGGGLFIYLVVILNMSLLLLFFLAGQDIFLQMSSSAPEASPPTRKILFPDQVSSTDGRLTRNTPPQVVRGMGQRKIVSVGTERFTNAARPKGSFNIAQKNLCGGEDYCENPDVYPTSLVNKLIKRIMIREGGSHSLVSLLDEDREVGSRKGLKTEGRSANTLAPLQLRNDDNETPVCVSVHEYIVPKRAITKDNNFRFIINDSGKFRNRTLVQKVLIGKCYNPGNECTLGSNFIPSDYNLKTVCRQKYTYKRLLAVSDSGEEMVDSFKFPSCCVCHYKEDSRGRNG